MSSTTETASRPDRVPRWPVYAGTAVIFFVCFATSWPAAAIMFSMLFLLWAPLFAIVVIGFLAASIWTLVRSAIERRWKSVLSAAAFPALALLALPASRYSGPFVDQAHFLLFQKDYLDVIARLDPDKDGQIAIFDWGGNAMVGLNRFLVFDKSDELPLPEKDRSLALRNVLASRGLQQIRNIQPLAPHFYVLDR